MTTRLLVVADAGKNTGFERVARGICTYLNETGSYEIVQRGIQYYEDRSSRTYPWPVKSWGGDAGDPLGTLNFTTWLDEDRPDAVLVIEDSWNITNYMAYKPRELPTVAYFPVDCPNLKWTHVLGLGACAEAASYTKFGAVEAAVGVREGIDLFWDGHRRLEDAQSSQIGFLQFPNGPMLIDSRLDRLNRYQNPSNWNVIPHGMDQGIFEPRDKQKARDLWGMPQDAFIVLNVNTNQFRKRLDQTIRAFATLYRERKDALLVFHCATGDLAGWDLLQLARYYGVDGRVACIHHKTNNLSDDALCWLYNIADVQINTSGGEGWGLTSIEGAACGVPQLVPDWSATRELWTDYGVLLPIADWRHEPKYLNTAHANVDAKATGELLIQLAGDATWRTKLSESSLAQAKRQLTWDAVGEAFDTLIKRALVEPAPSGMGFEELIGNREPEVRSELAGRL